MWGFYVFVKAYYVFVDQKSVLMLNFPMHFVII